MKTEHILTVKAKAFDMLDINDCAVHKAVPISGADIVIAQRESAETDETLRQIIPYVVLVNDNDEVLTYSRTKEAGEARLHGNWSIGFGGHVDLEDVVFENSVIDLGATVSLACKRELQEELALSIHASRTHSAGFILDNSDEVGRVHAGELRMLPVNNKNTIEALAKSSEDIGVNIVGWVPIKDLKKKANRKKLEKWSSAALDVVDEYFPVIFSTREAS